jgi:hypothetical protein
LPGRGLPEDDAYEERERHEAVEDDVPNLVSQLDEREYRENGV